MLSVVHMSPPEIQATRFPKLGCVRTADRCELRLGYATSLEAAHSSPSAPGTGTSPQDADWSLAPFTTGWLSQEDTVPSRLTDEPFQTEPEASEWGRGAVSAAQGGGPTPVRRGPAGAQRALMWTPDAIVNVLPRKKPSRRVLSSTF